MDKQHIDQVKSEIINNLNGLIEAYRAFGLQFKDKDIKGQGFIQNVLCPLHGDNTNPSFSFHATSGHFKCHACSKSGSVFDFYADMKGIPRGKFGDIISGICTEFGIDIDRINKEIGRSGSKHIIPKPPTIDSSFGQKRIVDPAIEADKSHKPIDKSWIAGTRQKLIDHTDAVNWLVNRGLNKEFIDKFSIGYFPQQKRVTIPIKCARGIVRHIRQHSIESAKARGDYPKTTNFTQSEEKAVARLFNLFPLLRMKENSRVTVFICEGELDAILLNQYIFSNGLKDSIAISGTSGAGTWWDFWNEHLYDCDVILLYDCDKAGRNAAKRTIESMKAELLNGDILTLKNVEYPLSGSKDSKDTTDYFKDHDFQQFLSLINDTDYVEIREGNKAFDRNVYKTKEGTISLHELLTQKEIHGRGLPSKQTRCLTRVKVSEIINVKSIGCKVNFRGCSKLKHSCHCMRQAKILSPETDMMNMINISSFDDSSIDRKSSRILCEQGNTSELDWSEIKQIYELTVSSTTEDEKEAATSIKAFVFSKDDLLVQPGEYIIDCWRSYNPANNDSCLHAVDIEPLGKDWNSFDLESSKLPIEKLKSMSSRSVMEDLLDMSMKMNLEDMLTVMMLNFLSVMHINFKNKKIRGWVNALIISDPGSGKSTLYQSLSDIFGYGNFVEASNTSRAGLVYGVYQNRCLPGAVVFADQDQLTIDEADKIKEDQGAALTAVFESGMVKANMIASGSWPARVRIMMLMNPNKKNCGELMHQCAYLLETFEEKLIRRIDIAMHQEVLGVTTSIEGYAKPKMLTEDLAKVWINFAWSRKPEDIEIQTETLRSISQQALNLSRKFSNRKIKLLNQSDAEDNLVRLSVAYAIFDRSFTVTGKVIVLENHVNLVCELLERIYCNELFALDKYSSFDRSMVEIDSKDIKIFDKYFNHLSDDDKYSIKDFISKICRTRMRASSLNAMPATRKNKIWRYIDFLGPKGYIDDDDGFRSTPKLQKLNQYLKGVDIKVSQETLRHKDSEKVNEVLSSLADQPNGFSEIDFNDLDEKGF